MSFKVKARNNLNIPIRLTVTESNKILITIGQSKTSLKDFYLVCIDVILPPNETWEEIGELEVSVKPSIKIRGREAEA